MGVSFSYIADESKLMVHLKEFQKLVIANAANTKGLATGDRAPDFTLPNAFGNEITLSEYLAAGIVIIKFYRGEWCPICNLDLREIQKYLPQISRLGAFVIAISPQNPDAALTISQKNELGFEVLSDANQEVIRSYGLQFDPGEDYHRRRDLSLLNGDGSRNLPVPATFVINSNSIIEAAHVEADYTQRMSPKEILDTLERISQKNDRAPY